MRWQGFAAILTVVVTIVLLSLTLVPTAWAAKYKVLYKFRGGRDGRTPHCSLVFDAEGNLYGTTQEGGGNGAGIIFRLSPSPDGSWTESVLHRFDGTDGSWPYAGLIPDTAGNLYGTTEWGDDFGSGNVFKLARNADGTWTFSVLYTFAGGADGASPWGVVFDAAGNLYGPAQRGGAYGAGSVFKLSPDPNGGWTKSDLHSFTGTDGNWPNIGMVLDAAGSLYGTTYLGGDYGAGTVFKLAPNPDGSWTESVLYTFTGGADGGTSYAGLVFDRAGNLYGTTGAGGNHGYGTAFQLMPNPDESWTERVIRSFGGRPAGTPYAGLVFDPAGNLYGTTAQGAYGYGTVFKLIPNQDGSWKMTKLHAFKGPDGATPGFAPLILDAAGNLYGTTTGGGRGYGVVFQITP